MNPSRLSSSSQRSVDTAGPVRCHYATDPTRRPNCTLTASVRIGTLALCPSCSARRSTLGKGQRSAALPPSPQLDVLDWIDTTHQQAAAAENTLTAAVTRARQAGHTWTAIGTRLGITRQAAQQRFTSRTPRAFTHAATKHSPRAY